MLLELGRGYSAIIDDEDFWLISPYHWLPNVKSQDYVRCYARTRDGVIYMHRLITGAKKGEYVDHINGNALDNRRSNLRVCTNSQNIAHSGNRGGTSQYKGVRWDKRTRRWVAEITCNYKHTTIGYFKEEDEAARAYNEKALELFGEYAYQNQVIP